MSTSDLESDTGEGDAPSNLEVDTQLSRLSVTDKNSDSEENDVIQSTWENSEEDEATTSISHSDSEENDVTQSSGEKLEEDEVTASTPEKNKVTKRKLFSSLSTNSPSTEQKGNKSLKKKAENQTRKQSPQGNAESNTDLPDKEKLQAASKPDLPKNKYIKCIASHLPSGIFDEFNIKFDAKTTKIDEFCKMLNEKKPLEGGSVDNIIKTFKKLIEDQLGNVSIDLNSITEKANKYFETKDKTAIEQKLNRAAVNDLEREVLNKIRVSTENVNRFYTETIRSGQYNHDKEMLRLLSQWITSVNEFMRSCIDVVRSILHPQMINKDLTEDGRETEQNTREIIFQSLFTSFSKIFLLHPRPQRITYKTLLKYYVTSEPDVRFESTFNLSGAEPATQLMMLCEVKRDKPELKKSRKKHALGEMVRTETMHQIGTELLCECSGSYFSPGAVGILCLRSQILFLFLDISYEHLFAIEENMPLDNMNGRILYTDYFDILEPKGRSQVMDILFYMARIQTLDFIHPF